MNNVGVAWDYPEYFAEIDVEVREIFPMAHIWLILYLRNRKHFLCFQNTSVYTTYGRGVARIFKGGGSIFYWKGKNRERAKLALLIYVGSGVKPRKTFHFLGFERPRLRENWHPECFIPLSIIPIHRRLLWQPLIYQSKLTFSKCYFIRYITYCKNL